VVRVLLGAVTWVDGASGVLVLFSSTIPKDLTYVK
jgi:hypothetical protein